MARYLFITYYYPPEVAAASHLYYQLATELIERGHEVMVVTGFPRYNAQHAGKEYEGKWFMREFKDGVQVVRVALPQFPRTKPLLRGGEEFINAALLFLTAFVQKKADVSLVYSPPLPLGLSSYFLKVLRGVRSVVNIQDLFPKEAIDIGLLKNPMLIKALQAVESFIYKGVDRVVVHSDGNRDYILGRGGKPERVLTIHNWIDLEEIHPGPKDNEFRKAHMPEDKFCVTYGGTMGWNQDMETLIRAINELRDIEDLFFLLVGDGNNKPLGQQMVKDLGLTNVSFLDSVPFDTYKELVRASDVGLVNLNPKLLSPVVPSKLLNLMGSAIPVAASLPLSGDAPKIIEESECGYVVDAGDYKGLAQSVHKLYQDQPRAIEMGKNGRRYAEEHFSLNSCSTRFEALFEEIAVK